MSYGYDEQLIDAVAVRRRRIEAALMFGDQRLRRTWSDRTRTFVGAAFLAVACAAGCVAVSFVTHLLSTDTTVRPTSTTPTTRPTQQPTQQPSQQATERPRPQATQRPQTVERSQPAQRQRARAERRQDGRDGQGGQGGQRGQR